MPLVIAHRGASAYHPENSLAAFRAAVEMGADGIELDVHATRDGDLVVRHDERLHGRTIGEQTVADVRRERLPNGEPIPTLTEALSAVGSALTMFIEVKSLAPGHDSRLLACLDAGPSPAKYRIHSFDHRIVRRLRSLRENLPVGVLSSSYLVRPLPQLFEAGAGELWQHESLIDVDLVTTIHGAGFRVYAWTVDDPARMEALTAMGIDGICTNKPDLARRVVGKGAEGAEGAEGAGEAARAENAAPGGEVVKAQRRQLG